MGILEHDFLIELLKLQEKHGFYIKPESNLYSEDETVQLVRIPKNAELSCRIEGTYGFQMIPVPDSQASINHEQKENSNNG